MFIQVDDSRMINLENVSWINILREEKRIAFNFNVTSQTKQKDGTLKRVADYYYWNFTEAKDIDEAIKNLEKAKYFKEHFFSGTYKGHKAYINLSNVMSLKVEATRIIFNLNNIINKDKFGLMPDFVWVDVNEENLEQNLADIQKIANKI